MMEPDDTKAAESLITRFIAPAAPEWRLIGSSYENNSVPLGNDTFYALSLGIDGRVELAFKEHHGYTFELELYLIVRGRWELRALQKESFAIQILEPEFQVVHSGPNLSTYIEALQAGRRWVCRRESAGFAVGAGD